MAIRPAINVRIYRIVLPTSMNPETRSHIAVVRFRFTQPNLQTFLSRGGEWPFAPTHQCACFIPEENPSYEIPAACRAI